MDKTVSNVIGFTAEGWSFSKRNFMRRMFSANHTPASYIIRSKFFGTNELIGSKYPANPGIIPKNRNNRALEASPKPRGDP